MRERKIEIKRMRDREMEWERERETYFSDPNNILH